MTGRDQTATISGGFFVPPPGWARVTDHIMARVRARSIDDRLLRGAITDASPVVLVRRARLLNRRYRSAIAASLRRVIAATRQRPGPFGARLPLRTSEVLDVAPLILTLADDLEHEESVSPRGVILADRLVRDGDSPVYGLAPVHQPRNEDVESAVKRARAALLMG